MQKLIMTHEGPPHFQQPLGIVRFVLYEETINLIRNFQIEYPDVSVETCSRYLNKAIVTAIEEFKNCVPNS